jgi:NADP-dependent 3-hydroxy acid dehydrogenase YdfG
MQLDHSAETKSMALAHVGRHHRPMPSEVNAHPVALITGGSSGIGAAAARQLLGHGHRVAVTGRRADRLESLADDLGRPPELLTIVADAADPDAMSAAVERTVGAFGRLDTAVANAGVASHDGLADGDPALWREMVLTNVLGPGLLVRFALPHLRQTRGRIVFLGSVAGHVGIAANIYGATKWAVTALAENTRLMCAKDGVGVTLISPGRVDSDFWTPVGGPPAGDLLSADQLASSLVWAVLQPAGVDVNTMIVRPSGAAI